MLQIYTHKKTGGKLFAAIAKTELMKSRASFKNHPIHPMLIGFPLSFFTGALVFDVLSVLLNKEGLWYTGYHLVIAGILGGLAAAVPGIVDYFLTVPPNSSGKKRATKHGLLNVTNLVVFVIVFFLRRQPGVNTTIVILLEAIGFVLLCFAGWLGGTLVYRNQIGVDPRYANAGKWKEENVDTHEGRMEVATIDELKVNQMKLLHIDGKRIVLGRTENSYVAFDDHCTHKGGSLAGGSMICETVQCPWHGSQFDLTTGDVKAGPAKEKISVYPVETKEGKVCLRME
jgi:nitrite reductase/ring-hydroxylating ferredoxin subunit/uncharacterized membrane protein